MTPNPILQWSKPRGAGRPASAVAAVLAMLALALVGCAAGTDYVPGPVPIAEGWRAPSASSASADPAWWTAAEDPILDSLVKAALSDNLDIEAALARLDQARGALGAARAALAPGGSLEASASRSRQSLEQGLGQLAGAAPDFARTGNAFDLTLGPSWEVDLAGGLRRYKQAAHYDAEAAAASVAAARSAIAAETVEAYVLLRITQERRVIAGRQSQASARLTALVAQRLEAGLSSRLEFEQSQTAQAAVEATLPALDAAIEGQMNRLAVLCGRPVQTERDALQRLGVAPRLAAPGLGTPEQMLRRRPDLRVAERRLAASHARIGGALAEYYPKVSVSALAGFQSGSTGSLLTDRASVLSGVAGLRWRLFDFARIDAEVASARGAEREALSVYRQGVLRAAEEVETAMAQSLAGDVRLKDHSRESQAAERARDLAQVAWKGGVVSVTEVLEADRRQLQAQNALASANSDRLLAVIAVHRALGG